MKIIDITLYNIQCKLSIVHYHNYNKSIKTVYTAVIYEKTSARHVKTSLVKKLILLSCMAKRQFTCQVEKNIKFPLFLGLFTSLFSIDRCSRVNRNVLVAS